MACYLLKKQKFSMKLFRSKGSLTPVALTLLVASTAQAHPGHDGGHDLTWDFSAVVQHVVTNPDHLIPLLGVLVLSVLLVRSLRNGKKRRAES
jgi:hydrogenase/urease accessory protein HupE